MAAWCQFQDNKSLGRERTAFKLSQRPEIYFMLKNRKPQRIRDEKHFQTLLSQGIVTDQQMYHHILLNFSAFLYVLLWKRQEQFLETAFPLQTYQCLASFTTPYKPHQLSKNMQEESSGGVSSEVSCLPFLCNIIGQYNSCFIFLKPNVWLDFGQDTEYFFKSYTLGIKKSHLLKSQL